MNPTQTGLNYSAIIAAIVSLGSMVSMMLGHPALAAIISDPATANEATAVLGGAGALISAFASPVHSLVTHTPPVIAPPAK